jgi:hypothetical protein
MSKFVQGIKEIVDEFSTKQQQFKKAKMEKADWKIHNNSKKCWICDSEFSSVTAISKAGNQYLPKQKVVDHCHTTGKYIGAAHSDCNLKRQNKRLIPIFVHNLSKYDAHMFVKILDQFGDGKITIIPKTEEDYVSFSKKYKTTRFDVDADGKIIEEEISYEIRFLDSYRFMAASLDTLSSNLLKENRSQFKNLLKYTSQEEQDSIFWEERVESKTTKLILDNNFNPEYKEFKNIDFKPRIKGIYPYEFTDSWEKFDYDKILSEKDFYDNLNQKEINEQEYAQYLKVWKTIPNCNLGKYSDLYLKTDVLALADVMENFRDIGLKHYELDPVYYYTTPGYSFDACLKKTKVELNLVTDYRMLQLLERGIRGGISCVCGDRYVDVEGKNYTTNPSINKNDSLQEWLLYLDAVNLYGYAMTAKLPTGNLEWIGENQLMSLDQMIRNQTYDVDSDSGYILNVDLVVPKTKKFENYPLAPESKTIEIEQLSEFSKKLLETGDNYHATSKLMLDFTDKKNYVIHIKNLILYHRLGCEFKINEAISFKQSNWLAEFIELNTNLRKQAKNDFEKDFFKLMNNSMYGKTMEAIRERVVMHIANNWKQAAHYIKKPTFKKLTIFNDNLIAIHMRKNKIVFDKPIYIYRILRT